MNLGSSSFGRMTIYGRYIKYGLSVYDYIWSSGLLRDCLSAASYFTWRIELCRDALIEAREIVLQDAPVYISCRRFAHFKIASSAGHSA
jgi:hypothetical protein